jgi:TonB family protein
MGRALTVVAATLAMLLVAMTLRARAQAAPGTGQRAQLANPAMAEWHRSVNLRINRMARYLGKLSVRGETVVGFRVDRSGRLTESRVVRSSGNTELDGAFLAVVRTAGPFPPLPASYPGATLANAITMTSGPRKGDFNGMKPLRPYPAEF